jgi:hypothetical protein
MEVTINTDFNVTGNCPNLSYVTGLFSNPIVISMQFSAETGCVEPKHSVQNVKFLSIYIYSANKETQLR